METLTETLLERVDKLLEAQKGDEVLLSVTPPSVMIGELFRRCEGLEQALREVTVDVHRLSAGDDS